jgi:hypothetical protein
VKSGKKAGQQPPRVADEEIQCVARRSRPDQCLMRSQFADSVRRGLIQARKGLGRDVDEVFDHLEKSTAPSTALGRAV